MVVNVVNKNSEVSFRTEQVLRMSLQGTVVTVTFLNSDYIKLVSDDADTASKVYHNILDKTQ